jgi:hypothetical protein
MWILLSGFALLLVLFVSLVFDDDGARGRPDSRGYGRPFDLW